MAAYAYRRYRPRYRYRGKNTTRDRAIGLAIGAVLIASAGTKAAAVTHHGGSSVPASAVLAAAGGGTLSCSDLEALWESAGGSPGTAFMAAEIAKAESGGRQYATDLNGGASTDRGYWQVNSVHGSLSTYDASGNARAAVLLSDDGTNWNPWVTFATGAYQGQC